MPAYIYASREDHIVPWRSAYRTVGLLGGDPTFVLGASGHIAGVINPASKNRRNYWTNELLTDDADDWLARAEAAPEAGGRTGRRGSPNRAVRAIRRRQSRAMRDIRRWLRRPARYVVERAD